MNNIVKPLFSEYYLTKRIQLTSEWQEEISQVFEFVKIFYKQKQAILTNLNESQTEEEWIKPIFDLLGFSYIVQTSLYKSGKIQRPDYSLFLDENSKTSAYNLREDETAFYSRVVAVADAKYWQRNLSENRKNDNRDTFKNSNPSFQIVNYLDGTRVDWGILTNGRLWRLYYRQSASPIQQFYEVDLVNIITTDNLEQFKYFWLFFRQQAFIKDQQNRNFLERVREESTNYAREIGGELKSLVFNQVFANLAGGFVAFKNQISPFQMVSGDETLSIYQATLSFLYKILFLLYAEAKNLLPIDQNSYRDYSLSKLLQEIAPKCDRKQVFSETSTQYYDNLLSLFRIIDRGDTSLNVPAYNGGLFKVMGDNISPENQFLLQYKLSDAVLAPVLDQLARIKGESIDYKFLGVRDLGTIYEGLLEYKLVIDDGVTGKVHLENDKGERRETGSYYTPEYIVDYIVQHTLDPILAERADIFGELMREIRQLRHDLQDSKKAAKTIELLRKDLGNLERKAYNILLDIKVCDPAMGSGHFLVTTVDYITRKLIVILNEYPENNPILEQLERIKSEIITNLTHQGINIDSNRLSPDNLLHRAVMKRCIYGVDLNPMAVELAKVSLWLHSFTVGAPLSFLDHHLRCGNSLIGCMAKDVQDEFIQADKTEGYLSLFQTPFHGLLQSANVMQEIANLSDATFAEVEQSQRYYESFDREARVYKRLLDVYISQYFGLKKKEIESFFRIRLKNLKAKLNKQDTVLVETARRLYEEKRFFHWDLEFPEVFIDLAKADWKENPGFDVVLGNPPYGLINTLQWLSHLHHDIFVYFWNLGLHKTKKGGYISFITPSAMLTGINYQSLRQLILKVTNIKKVLALPYDVFIEAYIDTCILVLQSGIPENNGLIYVKKMDKRDKSKNIAEFVYDTVKLEYWQKDHYNKFIIIPEILNLQRFMNLPNFINLGSIIRVERGVQLYNRKKHTSEQIEQDFLRLYKQPDANSLSVYYPELLGEELSRYRLESYKKTYIKYCDDLASKRDVMFFTNPRVVLRRLLSRQGKLMSSFTSEILITTDSILNILILQDAITPQFITTLLNSQLISWIYTNTSVISIKDDFPQVTYEELKDLPIPIINFTTPEDLRKEYVNRLIQIYSHIVAEASSLSSIGNKEDDCTTIISEHIKEEKTDIIHDFLAYLAQKMIELNKQKQTEIKGFLDWLTREIGADIDTLTNKTAIKNYLGDYQKEENNLSLDELLDILKKNRKKLNIDPSSRQFQTLLSNEYQTSLNTLLPLKQQLKNTDKLIDKIVYYLYELNDEEIAIIEGK